jgi:hypothetical protein
VRTYLRAASPVVGIAGASGLKFLACLWFAIGLGTVTLLPKAGDDREHAVAIARIPAAGLPEAEPVVRGSTPPTQPRRAVSRHAVEQQLRSPHATPTVAAVGVASTVERPRTVRRRTRDVTEPVATAVSLETPAATTTPRPVAAPELPVVGDVSVPPPPLPVDVPALPAVPQVELP